MRCCLLFIISTTKREKNYAFFPLNLFNFFLKSSNERVSELTKKLCLDSTRV